MAGLTSRHGPGARSVNRLEHLLAAQAILLLPTAHDPLSAWLCEMAGFEAVLVSRSVLAMAVLATDEPSSVEDEVVVGRVVEICRVVSIPVVVDLTPVTSASRLHRTAVTLAMSGAAGVVVDDLAPGGHGVVSGDALRERLLAARDGLDRRGLALVVAARTLAAVAGDLAPAAALERLTALRPFWRLGVVDGLAPHDLLTFAGPRAPDLLVLDGNGDDAGVRDAQEAGFRAYAWGRPLLDSAVVGMRRVLADLDEGRDTPARSAARGEGPKAPGGHAPVLGH